MYFYYKKGNVYLKAHFFEVFYSKYPFYLLLIFFFSGWLKYSTQTQNVLNIEHVRFKMTQTFWRVLISNTISSWSSLRNSDDTKYPKKKLKEIYKREYIMYVTFSQCLAHEILHAVLGIKKFAYTDQCLVASVLCN